MDFEYDHYLRNSWIQRVMKKIIIVLVSVLLLSPSFSLVRANCNNPVEVIILDGGSGEGTPGHRSPGFVPIMATYYPSLSGIQLNFSLDLGAVTVVVENLTSGSISQTLIYAAQGTQFLPVSSISGSYGIAFILPDGHIYLGTYEIE